MDVFNTHRSLCIEKERDNINFMATSRRQFVQHISCWDIGSILSLKILEELPNIYIYWHFGKNMELVVRT